MTAHGLQLRHVGDDFLSLLEKSSLALDAVARKMDAEFASRYEKAGVRDSCEFEYRLWQMKDSLSSTQVNPLMLCKRIKTLSQ